MYGNLPRAVRALRLRTGATQASLGRRARVSRQIVSRIELGRVSGLTVASLERVTAALGATLNVQVRWQGEQLDRLIDASHAAIQHAVATLLADFGWIVRPEVSFNHYGDRGRIDIAAYHPIHRLVLIVEIKSGIGDIQETLGRLDVKIRLGERIARDLGWTDVSAVISALVVGDSRAARRTIASHSALFVRFGVRGRRATSWLRRPTQPIPAGLLWFVDRPDAREVSSRRHGSPAKRPNAQVT